MKINMVLKQIVNRLKPADPYKIVLFGSHAKGTATSDSDIDLMVILDSQSIAKSYDERMKNKLYMRRLLRDINYKQPMDILVYSRAN